MISPPRKPKRQYTRRWYRQSGKRVDQTGAINGRLLCMEWLGTWRGRHWWRAICDCGKEIETRWRRDIKSCGCQNREVQKDHSWETQRPDGRWGLNNVKRLRLADGTYTTIKELAAKLGVSIYTMHNRVNRWPQERWLDPVRPVGRGNWRRKYPVRRLTRSSPEKAPEQTGASPPGSEPDPTPSAA
jgi:hypothetical protein